MPNTKSTFSAIDTNLLADVNGGCGGGGRRCHGHCRSKTVNIVNNYAAAAPAAAPAAASNGFAVNVSAGYAQA